MARATHGRWIYIAPTVLIFWIIANIDKLGISVIAANPVFLKAMGLIGQPARIGLLFTAFTFVTGLSNFGAGFVVDRLGARRSALISLAVWTVTMTLGGLSSSYGEVLLSRMLLGISEASLWPLSNKFVRSWFPAQERGRAQAAWVSGLYLGPAIAAPVIVAVVGSGGWQDAFFLSALLSLVISLPMFFFLTRDEPASHFGVNAEERVLIERVSAAPESPRAGFGAALGNYRYWLTVIAYVMAGVVFFGLGFWLPSYLLHARHFSAGAVGGLTSFAWLMGLAAVALVAVLSDRLGRPSVLGAASFFIGAVCLYVATTTQSAGLAVVMAGFGFAADAGATEATQVLLHRLVSREVVGRAAGIMVGCGATFGGFSPTIMGALVGLDHGSYGLAIGFLVLAMLVGTAAFLIVAHGEVRTQAIAPAPGPSAVEPDHS